MWVKQLLAMIVTTTTGIMCYRWNDNAFLQSQTSRHGAWVVLDVPVQLLRVRQYTSLYRGIYPSPSFSMLLCMLSYLLMFVCCWSSTIRPMVLSRLCLGLCCKLTPFILRHRGVYGDSWVRFLGMFLSISLSKEVWRDDILWSLLDILLLTLLCPNSNRV